MTTSLQFLPNLQGLIYKAPLYRRREWPKKRPTWAAPKRPTACRGWYTRGAIANHCQAGVRNQHRARKWQMKSAQTRNSQIQRRQKRPNRNQPKLLGRRRKHTIVYAGALLPPAGSSVIGSLLGLVPGVVFGGGFVLAFRLSASSVAFGSPFWRRFRFTLSSVRLSCWFRTLS